LHGIAYAANVKFYLVVPHKRIVSVFLDSEQGASGSGYIVFFGLAGAPAT
jgi:hypothetical protein